MASPNPSKIHKAPILDTPLVYFFDNFLPNAQSMDDCRDFELMVVDCYDAYGWKAAQTKCARYSADLKECMVHEKRGRRVTAMTREFHKGKDKKYIPTPPMDFL